MQLKSPFIAFTSIVCVAALSPATRPVSTSTTLSPCYTSLTSSVTASITHVSKTQIVLQPVTSAVITLGPNEFEKHDPRRKRQECFNDQGFSVDCATWTGYYYTGEGGGGSGSGEPQTTIISYAGNAAATRAYGCAGLLLGLVAFLL
jgi:hypothetical protein